jgi:CRP/FNR family transcriptional regulator, cyclic AMP receptor protein
MVKELARSLADAKGVFRRRWSDMVEQRAYKGDVAPFDAGVRERHTRLWEALIEGMATEGNYATYLTLIEKEGRVQARASVQLQPLLTQLAEMLNMVWNILSDLPAVQDNPKLLLSLTKETNALRTKAQDAILRGYQDEIRLIEAEHALETELARTRRFSELDIAEVLRGIPAFQIRKFKPQQLVFEPCDSRSTLYFILEGRIRIYELLPDGREVSFSILSEKDVFAQSTDHNTYFRNAYAETMTPVVVASIQQSALEELVARSPVLAYRIINSFSAQLCQSQRLIQGLLGRDISVRMARLLLQLAQEFGAKTDTEEEIQIRMTFTHQELADMIGSNRVTVTRKLLEFQQKELISAGNHTICITDFSRLTQIAA